MINKSDLAINGGNPIRIKSFATSCYISGNEKELILECLESNNWSTFKGATEGWGINEVGKMKSVDAAKHGALDIRFLGGKYVRELEAKFAEKFNVQYAVSSNSATSCLIMALGALNLGPGDEVICPSMSFNATANMVILSGAKLVLVDIHPETLTIDPDLIEKNITI